jgi:hypothetical protein
MVIKEKTFSYFAESFFHETLHLLVFFSGTVEIVAVLWKKSMARILPIWVNEILKWWSNMTLEVVLKTCHSFRTNTTCVKAKLLHSNGGIIIIIIIIIIKHILNDIFSIVHLMAAHFIALPFQCR